MHERLCYMADEGPSAIVSRNFILSRGGKATSTEMNEWQNQKREKALKINNEIHKVLEAMSKAYDLEKKNPSESMTIYQSTLPIYEGLFEKSEEPYLKSRFLFSLNRYTMLLEKTNPIKNV